MKKFFRALGFILIIIAIIALSSTVYFLEVTKDVVFDKEKLVKNVPSFTLYDEKGTALKSEDCFSAQYAEISEIPEYVRNAFIAIEDKRFYTHGVIDFRSIARATVNNLKSFSFKEGASTISQQLVKNAFLSNDKNLKRKLKEIRLTAELEKNFTKEQILEMYLNTIYFGEGAYGISSASSVYFNKTPDKLTENEGALLAGLINAPTKYNPFINYDNSVSRKNVVLSKMLEQKYIKDETFESLKNEKITLSSAESTNNRDYYLRRCVEEVYDLLSLDKMSSLSGYKIYTYYNGGLQKKLPSLADYGIKANYSYIVIDNASKSVIAASSDAGDIRRCPASAVKPWLIYAPCFEERIISPATKILDERTDFGGYSPSNYNNKYYGYVNSYTALPLSLNVPALKLYNALSADKAAMYAEKLGVTLNNRDLSAAIGNISGGITLKQLAECYMPFADGGNYSQTAYISKIVDRNGYTVYNRNQSETKVFSEETCYLMDTILNKTVTEGTAKKLRGKNYTVCAKTGTNGNEKGNQDAYCVAFTKDHTVAVWLGKADNTYMENSITGGSYPAMIVNDILNGLYTNSSPQDFIKPNGIISVGIDKSLYDNDCRIVLPVDGTADKDILYFDFIKGTEPTEKLSEEIKLPVLVSYKIACKSYKIMLECETENADGYTVYRTFKEKEKHIGDFSAGETFTDSEVKKNGVYKYTVIPYRTDESGKKIYGNKVELPPVKTDKDENVKSSDWWDD